MMFQQKHESTYDPSFGMIAFNTILFLFLESLGNFLLICIVNYEKYGMNPQKRTVTNQLLSSICSSVILFNVFVMPFMFAHRSFGPKSRFYLKKYQKILAKRLFIFPNHFGRILKITPALLPLLLQGCSYQVSQNF